MIYFNQKTLLESKNRHLYSEAHVRIEVLTIPPTINDDLFSINHGQLIISILSGKAIIKNDNDIINVQEGDEIIIEENESFSIIPNSDNIVKVQYIWVPGMNPCKKCYEMFYK